MISQPGGGSLIWTVCVKNVKPNQSVTVGNMLRECVLNTTWHDEHHYAPAGCHPRTRREAGSSGCQLWEWPMKRGTIQPQQPWLSMVSNQPLDNSVRVHPHFDMDDAPAVAVEGVVSSSRKWRNVSLCIPSYHWGKYKLFGENVKNVDIFELL